MLRELATRLPLLEHGFDRLLSEAAERSALLGRWIQVQTGSGAQEGVAESLDADGHLLLRTADGALQILAAGEVTLQSDPAAAFR